MQSNLNGRTRPTAGYLPILRDGNHAIPGLFIVLAIMVAIAMPASAHTDFYGLVDVDHALIQPVNGTDRAILKFRIRNNTGSVIQLLGVETPIARASRIMFDAGDDRSLPLASLGVKPEQTLEFASSHMWVELTGLTRALISGMHVPLRLRFAGDKVIDVEGDVGIHHDH